MATNNKHLIWIAAAICAFVATSFAATLPAGLQDKVDAELSAWQALGTDPAVVGAVKAYNANPPAKAASMTNEEWRGLSMLDPFVRSLSKNELAAYLKTKRDDTVSEIFVSGAAGGKVAFLAKTSSWSHAGKAKHDVPMSGKTWVGPIEVDDSTGLQQFRSASRCSRAASRSAPSSSA